LKSIPSFRNVLNRVHVFVGDLQDRVLLVGPSSRVNELASLRLRLMAELGAEQCSSQEVALASELRSKRRQMLVLIGEVESCKKCGRGYPRPNGHWDGGYCCGGITENLFRQEELACLRASGTLPTHLRPPRGVHAGCVFRGPKGCSLAPEHRPNLCVRYACKMLREEYKQKGIAEEVRVLASSMQVAFQSFCRLRAERLKSEYWLAWENKL